MEIKICGLTRPEDIEFVNDLNPEYVGFVFAASKRRIDKEKCKELTRLLNKGIKKVGVFVNSSVNEINAIAKYCTLDICQLHGEESPKQCGDIKRNVWKAFRIKGKESFENILDYDVSGYLLDAYHENIYGGTGKTFQWDLITQINKDKKIILAGGITPTNVQKAIGVKNVQIIDVSSGVESNGIKDYEKMKKLIERVRGNEKQ
ncbi:MAG: phosphoribosylanthranilate isomerase [Eubacteriaceae bacterium]